MANILMIAGKVICIAVTFILVVLIWKTAEYFNKHPDNDKNKPILAWDMLMLLVMLIYLAGKLIMM